MTQLKVRSTSTSSAIVSDEVIRETTTTRLLFRPMLVDNPHNSEASVKGSFLFQRKGPGESWADVPTEPLSTLKKGESYQLIKSAQLLELYEHLGELYKLHSRHGISIGEIEYVRAHGALLSLSRMTNHQLRTFLNANSAVGASLVRRLLMWISEADDIDKFVDALETIGAQALRNLNCGCEFESA
jgi:hypothetical protein